MARIPNVPTSGSNPFNLLAKAWNNPIKTGLLGVGGYGLVKVGEEGIEELNYKQDLSRTQDQMFLQQQQQAINYENMMALINKQLEAQTEIARLGLPAIQSQIDRQFVGDVMSALPRYA